MNSELVNIKVSIVIPTKDDEEFIGRCLSSIKDLDYPREEYEVIVVDGYSTDKTVDVARSYNCKIVYENVGTISGARNMGVKNSSGKYIVFTDADCVAERGWLKNLIKKLDGSCFASVGGPNITPEDDSDFAKCVGKVLSFLSRAGARYGFNSGEAMEIYHNPTCNVSYRKDIFLEVGGFNENLITCDDEEFDYRLREKGLKILFTPDARILHYRRPTWRKFLRMAFNYGLGRMQAIKLHRNMGRWFHYAPPTIILLVSLFLSMYLLNHIFALIAISISIAGMIGIGIMSLHLAKDRGNFFVIYGLITVWFFGYGFGMLRGILK